MVRTRQSEFSTYHRRPKFGDEFLDEVFIRFALAHCPCQPVGMTAGVNEFVQRYGVVRLRAYERSRVRQDDGVTRSFVKCLNAAVRNRYSLSRDEGVKFRNPCGKRGRLRFGLECDA